MAGPYGEVLAFNVVLLVASIPIALRVVCTTTLALGTVLHSFPISAELKRTLPLSAQL